MNIVCFVIGKVIVSVAIVPLLMPIELCLVSKNQAITNKNIQWNLSNPVTQGPGALGLNREVAVLHMTFINQPLHKLTTLYRLCN